MSRNISSLKAVCWDYSINENDVVKILLDKNNNKYPIDRETMRYKLLRYVKMDNLREAFSNDELYSIYHDINIKRIRNRTMRTAIPLLLKRLQKETQLVA